LVPAYFEAQCPQVGPLIGGLLSHPVDRFPAIFGGNNFLKVHPYFLPCAVPASLTALIWVITFQYLKETSSPKSFTFFPWRKPKVDRIPDIAREHDTKDPLPLRSLLIYDVVVTSANYASVALIDISFRLVLPVFLSTPVLLGGLGLSTPTIGNILFSIGCLNGMQLFYFARANNRWGTKIVFMVGLISTLPAFALFPVINILARHSGYSFGVWLALGLQVTLFSFLNLCYGEYPWFSNHNILD
jgi:ABC-type anion transport system duplicated permease subunit